jgi:hypothetical protein
MPGLRGVHPITVESTASQQAGSSAETETSRGSHSRSRPSVPTPHHFFSLCNLPHPQPQRHASSRRTAHSEWATTSARELVCVAPPGLRKSFWDSHPGPHGPGKGCIGPPGQKIRLAAVSAHGWRHPRPGPAGSRNSSRSGARLQAREEDRREGLEYQGMRNAHGGTKEVNRILADGSGARRAVPRKTSSASTVE